MLTSPRVLIIEDDTIVSASVSAVLAELGAEVCGVAASEREAVEIALRLKPHMLIVDVSLREGDGVSAAERIIRQHPASLVFLTGNAAELWRRNIVATIIEKPATLEVLEQALKPLLALHTREEEYRALAELSSDVQYSFAVRPDGSGFREWLVGGPHPIAEALSSQVATDKWWRSSVVAEHLPMIEKRMETLLSGQRSDDEFMINVGGEIRWACASALPIWDERQGRVVRILGSIRDITAHKRAEDMLSMRAAQQQAIAVLAQLALEDTELESMLQVATEVIARTLQADFCQLLELNSDKKTLVLRAGVGWEAGAVGSGHIAATSDTHAGYTLTLDEAVIIDDLTTEKRFKGSSLLIDHGIRSGVSAIIRRRGEPYGVLGVHALAAGKFAPHDVHLLTSAAHILSAAITRIADAEAVQEQRTRLKGILDTTADGIITVDESGVIESVNAVAERLFEYSEAELVGRNVDLLIPDCAWRTAFEPITPDERGGAVAAAPRKVVGIRSGGHSFPSELSVGQIVLGSRLVFIATVRDVTERIAAEEQLRQAQKMEAVGQLTGGIAHDFNNLLTVVLGNADVLEEQLTDRPELQQMAQMARMAAERGADLTQRLLAFSRRQALRPIKLDLNEVVVGLAPLLRRTLGEQVDFEVHSGADLGTAIADRTQVESTLLNLAVNARDAMPTGGKLTVETGNAFLDEDYTRRISDLEPGPYVLFRVSDTGEGMSPDILDRVFEPFFTTKEVGKGTGLGLSMVYGFVKQSGGHVRIDTTPGQGTSVTIYLPCLQSAPEAQLDKGKADSVLMGGEEMILVVEDDPAVRRHVVSLLRSLRYRVRDAVDGRSALELLSRTEEIDLMFTDIVMPGGISGVQLAQEARRRCPSLKVLLTSGYTDAMTMNSNGVDPDTEFLQKPYRRLDLARALRSAFTRGDKRSRTASLPHEQL